MKLTVASSPHIRGNFRTNRIMMDVVLALLPALAVGLWKFGFRVIPVTTICIGAAIACNLCSGASLWKHNFQGYGRIFLGVVEDDFHIPHIEGNKLKNFL